MRATFTWTRPIGGDTTKKILMAALRKSSWLRLVVSCRAASDMLELLWAVLRRTLRLMLPTSFRQSWPDDDDDDDAVPAPPPPPWLATASCWPVADDADDFFEGLRSRLGRRLGVPRPEGVPADADTVVLPGPTTTCCPATRARSPLGLVWVSSPPPPGPPFPPLPRSTHDAITGWPDRPPPLLNRRTRPRTRPLLRAVGPSSGASTLWLSRAPIQRERFPVDDDAVATLLSCVRSSLSLVSLFFTTLCAVLFYREKRVCTRAQAPRGNFCSLLDALYSSELSRCTIFTGARFLPGRFPAAVFPRRKFYNLPP